MQTERKTIGHIVLAAVISALFGIILLYSFGMFFPITMACGLMIPLPVMVTGFSKGLYAGIITALIASFIWFLFSPIENSILLALFFYVPSLFASWFLRLHQMSNDARTLVWYPLPAVFLQVAILVMTVTIIDLVLLSLIFEIAFLSDSFINDFITLLTPYFTEAMTSQGLTAAQIAIALDTFRNWFIPMLGATIAVYGFFFQIGSLYLTPHISALLNGPQRPIDNWPSQLRMPFLGAALLIGSMLAFWLMSENRTIALCLLIIITVLNAGFLVAGLAVVHHATRNFNGRIILLALIYIALFSVFLTSFIFFGLAFTGFIASVFPAGFNSGKLPPANPL